VAEFRQDWTTYRDICGATKKTDLEFGLLGCLDVFCAHFM